MHQLPQAITTTAPNQVSQPVPVQITTAGSKSQAISSTLPPLTPISGAGDGGSVSATAALQQVVQQVVEEAKVEQQVKEEDEQPMEIVEQSNEVKDYG